MDPPGEEEPQAAPPQEDLGVNGGPTPQQLNLMMNQALNTVNSLLTNLEMDVPGGA